MKFKVRPSAPEEEPEQMCELWLEQVENDVVDLNILNGEGVRQIILVLEDGKPAYRPTFRTGGLPIKQNAAKQLAVSSLENDEGFV